MDEDQKKALEEALDAIDTVEERRRKLLAEAARQQTDHATTFRELCKVVFEPAGRAFETAIAPRGHRVRIEDMPERISGQQTDRGYFEIRIIPKRNIGTEVEHRRDSNPNVTFYLDRYNGAVDVHCLFLEGGSSHGGKHTSWPLAEATVEKVTEVLVQVLRYYAGDKTRGLRGV